MLLLDNADGALCRGRPREPVGLTVKVGGSEKPSTALWALRVLFTVIRFHVKKFRQLDHFRLFLLSYRRIVGLTVSTWERWFPRHSGADTDGARRDRMAERLSVIQ